MFYKTEGIVIKQTKYNDTSRIITFFLKEIGKKSFIVYGFNSSRKRKQYLNLFQPLIQLNVEFNYQENRNLQKFKEISLKKNYISIPFTIEKSTTIIFLSEIIDKIIKNDYIDDDLYVFICNALNTFDLQEKNYANFHLIFLIQLSKHLGFEITNYYSQDKKYFNIKESCFTHFYDNEYGIDETTSNFFSEFLQTKITETTQIKINNTTRQHLLRTILKYYSFHIIDLQNIKSLNIFNQIFRH